MVHYQSLGGAWSFAFEPYYAENLTREFLSEKTQEIFMHEDMWSKQLCCDNNNDIISNVHIFAYHELPTSRRMKIK